VLKNRFASIVVALIGAAVVGGLLKFNQTATSYNQYIVGNLIGLFWLPMLTILFVVREDPDKWGFNLGSSGRIWALTGVLFIGLLALLATVSRGRAFQDYYPLFRWYPEFLEAFRQYPQVSPWAAAPWLMVYAELSYGMYMFCWEFFFRGYLLFGLSRSIGWVAVLVQAAAFGLLHYGKPGTEVIASFGAGVILGIIALNARSFVPCFAIHWLASISFDIMVVAGRSH
jgi:membrane protease YdiL (CAAX protease family)